MGQMVGGVREVGSRGGTLPALEGGKQAEAFKQEADRIWVQIQINHLNLFVLPFIEFFCIFLLEKTCFHTAIFYSEEQLRGSTLKVED